MCEGGVYAERLALEGGNRFANSIRPFCETPPFSHNTTRSDFIGGVGY
jgi:hypothetical protein